MEDQNQNKSTSICEQLNYAKRNEIALFEHNIFIFRGFDKYLSNYLKE